MVIVSKFWTKIFSGGKADAITIFPFIFLRKQEFKFDVSLINHERIHLRQALELGIFVFYIWYLLDFAVQYYKFRDFDKAYLNIMFEREAYANEHNLLYLKERKWYSFWKYRSNKKG